ncbi:hypothetical protein CASFOL_034948 [Castilleja foliolosa]|uniref:BHLH domain-containing protein n=1 Tax=Castilleja foliolosa TaxID=1961234 RepID=A0ABD3BSV0_9LAMI
MEKEGNYSENFPSLDIYNPLDEKMKSHVDHHMLNTPTDQTPPLSSNFYGSNSFDKLSFADVMQFADFGPKLALNQTKTTDDEEENGIDPVYFLKFPVLNDQQTPLGDINQEDKGDGNRFLDEKSPTNTNKSKRKRPRSLKTSEEVESQRMTHIAVERNRRKQMNEHLRVLRSLMPNSYVQRGDQASIIGGAIEFVRELEQLLQCLESQKRRRLYGDAGPRPTVGDPSTQPAQQQLMFPPPMPTNNNIQNDELKNIGEYETGLQEETAESKSCLADVEVKVLGFDALIKVLSRRRGGQLIRAIAALEDMQLNILHTNITTIEQTVLYSFNVKIGGGEARFTAEDIANSVQQIFSFIHASSSIN